MLATLNIVTNPFHQSRDRIQKPIQRKLKISTVVNRNKVDLSKPTICYYNGELLLRKDWSRTVIKDGDVVSFVRLPEGGGGSNPLKLILMIALSSFAPYLAGVIGPSLGIAAGTLGASLLTAGISFLGSTLINALIPPPSLPKGQQQQQAVAPSPTYTIGAQGNSARIGQAIPVLYGKMKLFPDFAAQPYAEFEDNEQYLYQLFCVTQGKAAINLNEIYIEDSPISSFSAEFQSEVVQPNTASLLFPTDVYNVVEVTGQELFGDNTLGPFIASPALTTVNKLAFDLVLPRGLSYINDYGGYETRSVTVRFYAQQIDNAGNNIGNEITLGNEVITEGTTTAIRRTYKYNVASGRYKISAYRVTPKDTNARVSNDVLFSAARCYSSVTRTYGDRTLLAIKIKATNTVSSQSSRKVNLVATRMLPIPSINVATNSYEFSIPMLTRSIAWAISDMCRAAYGAGVTEARFNLAQLIALDAIWTSRGDTLNCVFDSTQTFWESLTMACRAGRTRPYVQGGMIHFVRDSLQTLPTALFTSRNMVKNSFKVTYIMTSDDSADAVDVEYFDEITWKPRVVRAQLDEGVLAKTPAKIKAFGITNRNQAYREGMTAIASNRYRRKEISFETELEGHIPALGDLIGIQSDIPEWGQSGEVVGRTGNVNVTNSLRYSSQLFNTTGWASAFYTATSSTAVLDPNGQANAVTRFVRNGTATTDNLFARQSSFPNLTGNRNASIYVYVPTQTGITSWAVSCDYNDVVNSNTVTSTVFGAWVRVSLNANLAASRNVIDFNILANSAVPSSGFTFYATNAQNEAGTVSNQFVPTVATAVTTTFNGSIISSEPFTWTDGVSHFVLLRRANGSAFGPVEVSRGVNDSTIVFNQSTLDFSVYAGFDKEKTHITFGRSGYVVQLARVLSTTPREGMTVQVTAINEDGRVHSADGTPIPLDTYLYSLPAPKVRPILKDFTLSQSGSGNTPSISLSWLTTAGASKYVIEKSLDSINWETVAEITGNNYSFLSSIGPLYVRVAAFGGLLGPYITKYIEVGLIPPPSNVPSGTVVANGQTFDVVWETVPDSDGYYVEVLYDSSVKRFFNTTKTNFAYTLENAVADGGPWRVVTFKIQSRKGLMLSVTPLTLNGSNLAPNAPTLIVTPGAGNISITVSKSNDLDYSGTLIYASATQGFTPAPENLIYEGGANFYLLYASTTMYIKAAHYDTYGKSGLNFSTEYSVTPLASLGNKVAEARLYKWAATMPESSYPNGASTFTWTTGAHTGYTGTNGWTTSAPANPNTPASSLWVAVKQVVDTATASTTSLSWTSGYTITAVSQNGANGTNGVSALTVTNTNESHVIPTDSAGNNGVYTNSGTTIRLYEGGTELTYDGVGTANGTWTVAATPTNITTGTFTDSGLFVTVGNHSAISADTAFITYQITGKRADGSAISIATSQSFSRAKNGVDATAFSLLASTNVLTKSLAGAFTPATVTFSATSKTGTSASATYSGRFRIFENGSATASYTSSADENTRTYTPSSSSVTSIKAELYAAGGVTQKIDEETVTVVSDGPTGANGSRTAILEMYQWAASAPTTFPSGTSTYTWSTGQFTAPATVNNWSITPPAQVSGQTLWVTRTIYVDSSTSATSTVTWNATAAVVAGVSGSNGTNGTNGARTAVLELYQWASATPTSFPSGTSTYTWSTGQFTAPATANSWSLVPGAPTAGQTLYGCSVSYSDTLVATTSTVTWNTSVAYALGAAGTNGLNGVSAISVVSTNNSHTIPTDSAGNNGVYTNSGTILRVFEGATELTHDGVGTTAGKWKAVATGTGITSGAITTSGLTAVVASHSSMTADTATVSYAITGQRANGTAISATIVQTLSKAKAGVLGGDAIYNYIDSTSPVIFKNAPDAATSGAHTNITVTGKRVVGGTESTFGFLTLTGDGLVEATTATANTITTSIANAGGRTSYTVKMYNQATVSGATLLDTQVIPVVFKGATGADSIVVGPPGADGENIVPSANYDFVGSTLPGGFTFPGTVASSDSATTTTITNTVLDQQLLSGTINLNPLDSYLVTMRIKHISGAWEGIVYTANAGHSWSGLFYKSIPAPVLGEWTTITLDMRSLTIGGTDYMTGGNVTGLRFDFINAVSASVAIDYITVGKYGVAVGTPGATGDSYRVCYAVATVASLNATPTTTTTVGSSSFPVTNAFGGNETWTAALSTLTSGQYQFKLDGIYSASTGNTVWGIPYQAALKVGTLSAISGDLGSITAGSIVLDNAGFIRGGQSDYNTGSGYFLGYSGTTYKFSVGTSTAGLTWSGSALTIKGDLVAGSIGLGAGFSASSTGAISIKSATTGARLEMTNECIKVFDASNVLRVKIGNLLA
jgi:hypothetical protein